MTADKIKHFMAICDEAIAECESKLNKLQPAFLYEYEEIVSLYDLLEKKCAERELLKDLLRDALKGGERKCILWRLWHRFVKK